MYLLLEQKVIGLHTTESVGLELGPTISKLEHIMHNNSSENHLNSYRLKTSHIIYYAYFMHFLGNFLKNLSQNVLK